MIRLWPWVEIRRLGPREFVLLDGSSGARLKLGPSERFLLHELARNEQIEAVEHAFEAKFGRPLAMHQLRDLVAQLNHLGLIDAGTRGQAARDDGSDPFSERPQGLPAEPLSKRDQGANLNTFFDVLTLLFGWILHPIWTPAILSCSLLSIMVTACEWRGMIGDIQHLVGDQPKFLILSLSLAQTLLFVNLPRNLLMGMVCRRYGGRIRRFGLRVSEDLLLMTFYSDMGDSFSLVSDQGKRTWLAVDLWSQLVLGSIAVLGWWFCQSGSAAGVFCLFLIPPCLFGLVANLNIFMPYRAYWLLCHYLDEPLLSERALAETSAWLTLHPSPAALSDGERYWLRAYGLGYYLSKLMIDPLAMGFIGYWLIQRYAGVGVILFASIAFWYWRKPIEEYLMGISPFRWAVRCGGRWWFRWTARLGLVMSFVVLGFLPYNYEIVGECRILPATQQGVRALLADKVETILVTEGQMVSRGELIARLSGNEVKANVKMAEADLQKAQAQLDLLRNGPRVEDLNIARDTVEVRKSQLEFVANQFTRAETTYQRGASTVAELDRLRHDQLEAKLNLLSARESLAHLEVGYRPEQIRSAEAEVQRGKEKLLLLQLELKKIEITAPIRGRVSLPYMEQRPGQATNPGDLITTLHDDSRLHAEIAADEAAVIQVVPGMPVNIRLFGTNGTLLRGQVRFVSLDVKAASLFGNDPVRTDAETYQERSANSRSRSPRQQVRVEVDLIDAPASLKADLSGYARIVVRQDVFWRAVARPVVRFLRTEVWSWLP